MKAEEGPSQQEVVSTHQDGSPQDAALSLQKVLSQRFGERLEIPEEVLSPEQTQALTTLASRASHRQWMDRPVSPALIRVLAAVALSAPSKSDLQQSDIVLVQDPEQRARVQALVPGMPWIAQAPALMVVCGSGARFRRIFERAEQPFVNDHLDAFFNACTDASMVLMQMLAAAGAAGLVGVPISVLRDQASALGRILALPGGVFPVAGLCLGYPTLEREVSVRLSLQATLHLDRHAATAEQLDREMDEFDLRYQAVRSARLGGSHGPVPVWTEEKRRQYGVTHRADWGQYVRGQGYVLD